MMKKSTTFILCFILVIFARSQSEVAGIQSAPRNEHVQISLLNTDNSLWGFRLVGETAIHRFSAPVFEINGQLEKLIFATTPDQPITDTLNNMTVEYHYQGTIKNYPEIFFQLIFQLAPQSYFLRFRYELYGKSGQVLTHTTGHPIKYFETDLTGFTEYSEVRFSQFNEQIHSYELSENKITDAYFKNKITLMGPMMTAQSCSSSLLLAYEHGSPFPESYLQFVLGDHRKVTLESVKGNFYNGQRMEMNNPFSSVWFETGAVSGDQDMLSNAYRQFVLRDLSQNPESRKPYIFYNTWNFQERNKHWYKKPYLANMNTDRMLLEIEAAHRIGIEVFVIDAGWFEKTGDWEPSKLRFPDGLKSVKSALDKNGMKLGLWFNPTAAAISSKILLENKDCIKTKDGKISQPVKIWETEESYEMCLVSKYKDAFADELIRLYKELGVSYFKWDAIDQHGCNDPHHMHGTELNTAIERGNCFAYEMPRAMAYIVNKVGKACPQAIVDFDITENGRSVGLSFLSAGKYFLINNGPYYDNYNIPTEQDKSNPNIFFYPGAARDWICRSPLTYDRWLPSTLFLTHYFPDDPGENQLYSIGSLILGQNGIWGDLPAISDSGIFILHAYLALYKQVREDMADQSMIRSGNPGDNPEIYEKVNIQTGRGAIVVFANHAGDYQYVSDGNPDRHIWATNGADVLFDQQGHAKVRCHFTKPGAQIIFFGIK